MSSSQAAVSFRLHTFYSLPGLLIRVSTQHHIQTLTEKAIDVYKSARSALGDATDALGCVGEETDGVGRAQVGRSAWAALGHGELQLGGVVRIAARLAHGRLGMRMECAAEIGVRIPHVVCTAAPLILYHLLFVTC